MTEQEAKIQIESIPSKIWEQLSSCDNEAIEMAVEALEKLAEYEDLEEQGLLRRFPCKIGDTVWFIGSKCCYCEKDDCYGCPYRRYGDKKHERFVYEMRVSQFRVRNNDIFMVNRDAIFSSGELSFSVSEIGKTVFFTKEEAEAVLEKMKEGAI